jgi:bzd-type benzoyl-CoA reductase N subunit
MEVSGEVEKCLEMWRDPFPFLRREAENGMRLVGCFCSYTPEEILHAAGLTPVRLMGAMRSITHADAHLQAYCCSLARTDLDMALGGELDFLEGAVFVQTCDTMMRLSDIWRRNTSFSFHGDVLLPLRMGKEISFPFLREEIRRFREAVEGYLEREIEEDSLRESIRVYNRNRRLLRRLYDLRRKGTGGVDGLSAMAVTVAGLWMPKEDHNELLQDLVSRWEGGEREEGAERLPLMVSGSVCTTPDLFELLQELGADVVEDDLCCGRRYWEGEADEEKDPEEAVAERLWSRVNCPAKHQVKEDRAARLLRAVEESGTAGVVFYLQSFCEPHLFDVPYLRGLLREKGVPSLVLESELQSFSRGQLRTRLQAFVETITGV